MVTWIDNLDAACGPLTAAARRFALEQGFPEDPPRGAPALRKLLQAIEDRSHTDSTEPDEPFIEGAGAFLGVVLAERFEHVGHVQHGPAHGLQMGAHGYFDPFACVADTLSAAAQADCLLSGIAEAEAEAKTKTHAAQVTSAVAGSLSIESQGRLSLTRRVGQRLWVRQGSETLEVDIRGLLTATHGETSEVVDEIVTRFCRALSGNQVASLNGWADAQERVLPRLVGDTFEARMSELAQGKSLQLLDGPCGLRIAFVLQYEGRARYVRTDELDDWDVSAQQVLAQAIENLRKRPTRLLRLEEDGVVMVRTGDGYDSARILLPEVQDALSATLGSNKLVIALPHRDGLFACLASNGAACRRLGDRTQAEAERAPHALSASLWPLCTSKH